MLRRLELITRGFGDIVLLGSEHSPGTLRAREFLSRNRVPYEWVDVDSDAPARALAESLAGDLSRLPVVVFPDGSHVAAPSQVDLAARAGMSGIQEWLSFYFKSPQTAPGLYPEHDLFIQLMKLKNTLRYLRGEELITHLGREYYD